jgi:hypothetical protein
MERFLLIGDLRRAPSADEPQRCAAEGGKMKIYLMLMLMSTLLLAIRMTATPKPVAETLPQ